MIPYYFWDKSVVIENECIRKHYEENLFDVQTSCNCHVNPIGPPFTFPVSTSRDRR